MTHPAYPTRSELYAEAQADNHLTAQTAVADELLKLLKQTLEQINRLEFPSGDPFDRYCLEDLTGPMTGMIAELETHKGTPPRVVDRAFEMAWESV